MSSNLFFIDLLFTHCPCPDQTEISFIISETFHSSQWLFDSIHFTIKNSKIPWSLERGPKVVVPFYTLPLGVHCRRKGPTAVILKAQFLMFSTWVSLGTWTNTHHSHFCPDLPRFNLCLFCGYYKIRRWFHQRTVMKMGFTLLSGILYSNQF